VAVVVRCANDNEVIVDDEIAKVVARGEEANYSEALWLLQAVSGDAMVDFSTSAGAEVVAARGVRAIHVSCRRGGGWWWLRDVRRRRCCRGPLLQQRWRGFRRGHDGRWLSDVGSGGRTWSWRLRSGLVRKREREIRVRVCVGKEMMT